jgi:hypothetical protein
MQVTQRARARLHSIRRLTSPALFSLALYLLLAAPLARAGDAPLEVGFGRRSIVTKVPGVSLGGYGGRGLIPALGVHDACFVKAMVVRTPGGAIAIVTADLIGVQRTILEAIRARPLPSRVALRVDDILIAASHTHAGYGSLAQPTGGPGLDALFFVTCGPFKRAFFDELVEKIEAALTDAWDDLAPARLGVGAADVPGLQHNRGRPGGEDDPEIGVIEATAPDGRVRGLLVNFTGHPVILGVENLELSAEFPGAMQRELEARFPGATAMFTQGAEGDETVSAVGGPGPFARVEATGKRLADEVAKIAARIEPRERVAVSARTVEVEMPRGEDIAERLKALAGIRRSVFSEAVLGDTLLMGVPGEPCAQIGLDMKAAARARGFAHAFVIGLADDHCGYFVHASDYAPGRETSHEYEKRLNFYGRGIGAFIVRTHMLGFDPRPLEGGKAEGREREGF